ncbi:hypothetical protein FMH13_17640 [Vibrio cholerae]|nr:hypothetical protein [Vibrio cholerae]
MQLFCLSLVVMRCQPLRRALNAERRQKWMLLPEKLSLNFFCRFGLFENCTWDNCITSDKIRGYIDKPTYLVICIFAQVRKHSPHLTWCYPGISPIF